MRRSILLFFVLAACETTDGRPTYPAFEQSLLEIAEAEGLTKYVELIHASGGMDETVYGGTTGVFTAFAPTDAAVLAAQIDMANPDAVSEQLRYLTAPGKQLVSLLQIRKNLPTLTSTTIRIVPNGTAVTLSNSLGTQGTVVRANLEAKNGVLHVVDGVVLPPPPPPGPLSDELGALGYGALLLSAGESTPILDGDGSEYTVLAVPSEAFTSRVGEDLSVVDAELLENVFLTHVVEDRVAVSQLINSAEVRTLANTTLPVAGQTIGGASLGSPIDAVAENGLIHALTDFVDMPQILDVVGARPDLSDAGTGLTRTAIDVSPDGFAGDPLITVFVPTNAALASAGIDTATDDLAQLSPVLSHHVAQGQNTIDEFMDGSVLTTLNGDLTIHVDELGVVTVSDGQGNVANVVEADIRTSNGVMHVVDAVLLP